MELKVFRGGTVLARGREERGLEVVVGGGRVRGLGRAAARTARRQGAARVDLQGAYLAPGFVDIHTHGAAGVDFFRAGPRELEEALVGHYPAHGVTSVLLSLYPAPPGELEAVLGRLAGALEAGVGRGVAAGIHLEGPFLSPRKPGALPAASFSAANPRLARRLASAGRGWVRTQTIAPEVPGAMRAIPALLESRVVPFLGHSACDLEGARQAFRAGARGVTHLFNAMEGLHHRTPGPVAAALLDERVAVELIADGHHVAREALRLVARLKPPSRICLVSDSVPPCGLKEGRYRFAGAPVVLRGGRVTRPDGTLAGSALTLDRAVRVMVEAAGVSLPEAVEMATSSPARAAGLRGVGALARGARADLVVLDERARVLATYLGGDQVYRAGRGGR